jgi:GNAT superfamily N-acetyltransferase
MDVFWTIVNCPVYGDLKNEIKSIVSVNPYPWKDFAILCLEDERLASTKTQIVLGIESSGRVCALTWVSLPDPNFFLIGSNYAFIFNVFVHAQLRHKGLATTAMNIAIQNARKNYCSGVLLASNDQSLRNSFYSKIGFDNHNLDPWLMLLKFENVLQAETGKARFEKKLDLIIRSTTQHDLATIQSLCYQSRLRISGDTITKVYSEEIEEEFCKRSLKLNLRQLLLRGYLNGKKFVLWMFREENNSTYELLSDDFNDNDIHSLLKLSDAWQKKTYKIKNTELYNLKY